MLLLDPKPKPDTLNLNPRNPTTPNACTLLEAFGSHRPANMLARFFVYS